MKEVGLVPSDTGEPGGKETGQHMTHYVEAGGRFERACTAYLSTGAATLYHDRAGEEATKTRRKKSASKTKYTCPDCELNAWAKPEARLVCGDCGKPMEAELEEGGDS